MNGMERQPRQQNCCLKCLQATQHAGDDFAKMIQGDPGIEDIYYWGPEGPRVSTRGRTGMWMWSIWCTCCYLRRHQAHIRMRSHRSALPKRIAQTQLNIQSSFYSVSIGSEILRARAACAASASVLASGVSQQGHSPDVPC